MAILHRILPVLDIKGGQVVHGVAGQRERYAPIKSRIADSVIPCEVATTMCELVGSRDVYIADLDAIGGAEPHWDEFKSITRLGIHIWLDAGIIDEAIANGFLHENENSKVIFCLETLPELRTLQRLISNAPRDRVVFSLDLKAGMPITRDPAAKQLSAETIAAFAVDTGFTSMIVLDLAAVGTTSGLQTIELCRRLKSRNPELELVSGGGVRNIQDVQRYLDAGCHRVLVATALHSGSLGPTGYSR